MALLNFSAPYAPTAPPTGPFLAAAASASAISGLNSAAVNSLIYSQSAHHQQRAAEQAYRNNVPSPPAAPNRRTTTAPRRANNEPYQQQQDQQPQQRSPRYYSDDNYRSSNTARPSPQSSSTSTKKGEYPSRPSGYTRIEHNEYSNQPGTKTSLHAVLDYDDDFDDYSYDDDDVGDVPTSYQHSQYGVTPIQGPIFIKNGSVPVVPLYSYPVLNNGTFVQIPILWTALSLALGLEIRGEIIRGVPCIKRFHQLFCPTAGNSYPIERIERFIDENKALMKRMYGEFTMTTEYGPPSRETYDQPGKRNAKREATGEGGDSGGGQDEKKKTTMPPGVPDIHTPPGPDPATEPGESYFSKLRHTRQSFRNNQSSESGRVDACESKVEIVTPYWASNSAGKIRAIVNTQHFEQAIHQEVCSSKVQTKRCSGDCGCEQKYKWHRLLAYDPDNDCKGIFMDWFLFPSCCVCRCAPAFGNK
ncbi:protein spaetzle 3 [Periplaneta americana]|uniref:protein spaetzle 3 n=1 Tax=Periplaneta americana TaxID=6978 RepID=UPI0037E837DC